MEIPAMKVLKLAALGAALFVVTTSTYAGAIFDSVKKRGVVRCGVSTGIAGFSVADSKGEWQGLDVDLCRAIAATVFNDATKFKITPLTTQQRFTALQSGEIDVLTRNTTQTLSRDTTLGLIGVGVNYYDSQGVLVSKDLGVKSAKELNGATICVQPGTTSELNLADWFRSNKLQFKPVVIDKQDEIALRIIIPPITSQYLNLTKNSSLALAIGYPDIVSVVNTTLNQTGQAIEGILIIMGAYLVVSLSISLFMNWYNRRMALAER
eukprot:scaffold53.g4535.t1